MDGMFLGLSALFRDIFSEEPTDEVPIPTTELITTTFQTTTEPITVTNSTNASAILIFLPAEEEMHHTTATGLVVTGLLVLILVALFALCFLLRKYCRCAYDLHYSLNYGKGNKGAVLVPSEEQMEAGEMSKRSTLNVDSGINSRHPSEQRLTQSRPQSPSQQRPPRPPQATRSSVPRTAAEQRPLLEKGPEEKTLSVHPTGLYPVDTASAQETKGEQKD